MTGFLTPQIRDGLRIFDFMTYRSSVASRLAELGRKEATENEIITAEKEEEKTVTQQEQDKDKLQRALLIREYRQRADIFVKKFCEGKASACEVAVRTKGVNIKTAGLDEQGYERVSVLARTMLQRYEDSSDLDALLAMGDEEVMLIYDKSQNIPAPKPGEVLDIKTLPLEQAKRLVDYLSEKKPEDVLLVISGNLCTPCGIAKDQNLWQRYAQTYLNKKVYYYELDQTKEGSSPEDPFDHEVIHKNRAFFGTGIHLPLIMTFKNNQIVRWELDSNRWHQSINVAENPNERVNIPFYEKPHGWDEDKRGTWPVNSGILTYKSPSDFSGVRFIGEPIVDNIRGTIEGRLAQDMEFEIFGQTLKYYKNDYAVFYKNGTLKYGHNPYNKSRFWGSDKLSLGENEVDLEEPLTFHDNGIIEQAYLLNFGQTFFYRNGRPFRFTPSGNDYWCEGPDKNRYSPRYGEFVELDSEGKPTKEYKRFFPWAQHCQ